MLRAHGLLIETRTLPDHARFTPALAGAGRGKPVLLTEKDAVKCNGVGWSEAGYVEVAPEVDAAAAAGAAGPDRAARGRKTGKDIVSERLTDILACPVCKGPLAVAARQPGVPVPRGPARLSGARRHPGHAAGRGAAPRAGRQRAREPLAVFRVVIPARHASTRLSGKPLALLAGEPMILHVHRHRAALRRGGSASSRPTTSAFAPPALLRARSSR